MPQGDTLHLGPGLCRKNPCLGRQHRINFQVMQSDKHIRLTRGIAISDLNWKAILTHPQGQGRSTDTEHFLQHWQRRGAQDTATHCIHCFIRKSFHLEQGGCDRELQVAHMGHQRGEFRVIESRRIGGKQRHPLHALHREVFRRLPNPDFIGHTTQHNEFTIHFGGHA